jgi:hypothetical protein
VKARLVVVTCCPTRTLSLLLILILLLTCVTITCRCGRLHSLTNALHVRLLNVKSARMDVPTSGNWL